MTLINAITGGETFAMGQSKFHLFYSPSVDFPGREVHIGVAAKDASSTKIMAGNFPVFLPAAPGYKEALGKWAQSRYEVEDRVVLKLFGMINRGGGRQIASQYIQVRTGGPLIRISMPTVGWDKAQYQSVNILGRFDLLSLREATDLGVQTPTNYAVFHLPHHIERVFRFEVIESENKARSSTVTEALVNEEGETVVVTTVKKRRALEI